MSTNWDDLKYLLAVARQGTLLAAAERLGSNASTVSRRIQRLEADAGVPLLARQGDRWEPTGEARALLDIARKLELEMTGAERDLARRSERPTGRVVLNSFPLAHVMAFAPNVGTFCEMFPELDLELEYSPRPLSLAKGEADVSVREYEPTEGKLVKSRIATVRVGPFQLADAPPTMRWVGLTRAFETSIPMARARDVFQGAPSVRCPSTTTVAAAMMSSGKPGVLPSCVARLHPDLRPIDSLGGLSEHPIWLVYHESRRSDPKIVSAINWLRDIFPTPSRCLCGHCPALDA